MKYKLINQPNPKFSAIQQILFNRGVSPEDFFHYINVSSKDINSYTLLGEKTLKKAAMALLEAIGNNSTMLIVVDCDCDGYTSAALFLNYLYDTFPSYTLSCIDFFLHEGKQHGLNDCIDIAMRYDIILCPDSSSNDYAYHKALKEKGKDILVFDHHEAESISEDAIVINNQLSDYPNKDLSGVGITWQFCRYIDSLLQTNYADQYIDLVALGNCGDMMSMLSMETKYVISKGFKPENISNPFIFEMWQKNKFKLGEHITPMGAAFYIVPFVNAICRSGEKEEKELIFKSMLKYKAFEQIPSNKRGHKVGEMERVVDQAMRTCTNVKNKQTRAQDSGLEFLECMIKERNLLNHKVLLFLLEPGQIDRNIAGLIANRFMAKYQRPCCILTRVEETITIPVWDANADIYGGGAWDKGNYVEGKFKKVSYQGSARGCDKVGIADFKKICESVDGVNYAVGHPNAFGLSLQEDSIEEFITYTDEALRELSAEPIYFVDYIFEPNNCNPQAILDIAEMDSFWGKDFDEALVAVKNINVTKEMITVMKSNTLKITLPCGIAMIKFGATDEEIESLRKETGYVSINVVCTCNANEWMGRVTPQLMIEDYEITDVGRHYF